MEKDTIEARGGEILRGKAGKPSHPRLQATLAAARYFGVDLSIEDFKGEADGGTPSPAALAAWLKNSGLWVRTVQLGWRQLMKLKDAAPVVLLFADGDAGILVGVNAEQNLAFVKGPGGGEPVPVDELRMSEIWTGDVLLLRVQRGTTKADAPFTLLWLANLVMGERRSLRDIGLASLTLSFLTIFPPLLVMTVVDRVLTHHSVSTLTLLSVILGIAVVYETLLGHARRQIVLVVGIRMDTRLSLHVFSRLLRLPLDYFERHPAGETMHKIGHVYKVREFLTGKLLTTFLDLITLVVLLPFLFYLHATLAWMVLVCAALIAGVIFVSLHPLRRVFVKVSAAEAARASALGETIFGIKTVKSLALEPERKALWDERVAAAGKSRLAFGRAANWAQTIVTPLERFMSIGVVLVGAQMALSDTTGYAAGALFAFMMLSMRVAQPLVGCARLFEEYEEVAAAIGETGSVLNRPLEPDAAARGLRPTIHGTITFDDVCFTYPGSRTPALDRVTFSMPAGTMLGIVGRSGSGKSTITRLLQGISSDFQGFVKIDGNDLREVNLRHLRRNFGVVLQDNFLFRGTVRDNIIASRPGLTMEDAVRAARLAGAEDFIEQMPNGYETIIEEGSPNLSGGQRQRLAIARALITDPPILILDEPTSALDPESEALVNANILRIGHSRTTIVVSHRLSSLAKCDQILVMDKGTMVDIGSHPVLLERCPLYRQLWFQQTHHLGLEKGDRNAALSSAVA